ncbi:hypothetical protein PENTCL1PPCAC_22711, partial [Pristionchus entomophagus]
SEWMEMGEEAEKKAKFAIITQYETNGYVEYNFGRSQYQTTSDQLVEQLIDLDVSHSTTIMVPVELIDEEDTHRLGRVITDFD